MKHGLCVAVLLAVFTSLAAESARVEVSPDCPSAMSGNYYAQAYFDVGCDSGCHPGWPMGLRIFRRSDGAVTGDIPLLPYGNGICQLSVSADGKTVVEVTDLAVHDDMGFRLLCYNHNGQLLWNYPYTGYSEHDISPSGKYVAFVSGGDVLMLDGSTGKPVSFSVVPPPPCREKTNRRTVPTPQPDPEPAAAAGIVHRTQGYKGLFDYQDRFVMVVMTEPWWTIQVLDPSGWRIVSVDTLGLDDTSRTLHWIGRDDGYCFSVDPSRRLFAGAMKTYRNGQPETGRILVYASDQQRIKLFRGTAGFLQQAKALDSATVLFGPAGAVPSNNSPVNVLDVATGQYAILDSCGTGTVYNARRIGSAIYTQVYTAGTKDIVSRRSVRHGSKLVTAAATEFPIFGEGAVSLKVSQRAR